MTPEEFKAKSEESAKAFEAAYAAAKVNNDKAAAQKAFEVYTATQKELGKFVNNPYLKK